MIVKDRPRYTSARLSALRCLAQKRRGEHALTVSQIVYAYSSEWELDPGETHRLAELLSKAS